MDFSGIKSITIPEGNVKKITCGQTELWNANKLLSVGGKIYYIDSTASGATYKFFDANLQEVTASVGSTPVWYSIEGTPTKDKYYIFYENVISGKAWANDSVDIGTSGYGLGDGRKNTKLWMEKNSGAYIRSGLIWYEINELNKTSMNNDWYLPSILELSYLANAKKDGAYIVPHSGWNMTSNEADNRAYAMYVAFSTVRQNSDWKSKTAFTAYLIRSM